MHVLHCKAAAIVVMLDINGARALTHSHTHTHVKPSMQVLDRVRGVAAKKDRLIAVMLDTKGPEIRTAMLRNHEPIELTAGQMVTVVAGVFASACVCVLRSRTHTHSPAQQAISRADGDGHVRAGDIHACVCVCLCHCV